MSFQDDIPPKPKEFLFMLIEKRKNKFGKLIGNNIGYSTIIGITKPPELSALIVRCYCGNQFILSIRKYREYLKYTKNFLSCGCMKIYKHIRTYNTYRCMILRCYNPASNKYKFYGGKGVIVCDEWKKSFFSFFKDMGERPSGCTLDRVNNLLGYSKENCRWATNKQQQLNKKKLV